MPIPHGSARLEQYKGLLAPDCAQFPSKSNPGYNFPLLVDFDMLKLRSKTMVHGVGWYPLWLSTDLGSPIKPNLDQVLSYIATELAYGHGAYLSDEHDANIDFVLHAQLKYKHVFSVQRDYANATPTQILYHYNDSYKTVSDYIRAHPINYKNISSDEFMGQVKIVYDNGMIVCVYRNPSTEWEVTLGTPGGWFNWNTETDRNTGYSPTTTFSLPSKNGWVVYDPLKIPDEDFLKANDNSEHSPYQYVLKQNYPNPFNPSTMISYSIEKDGLVKLKIYNILGQEVTSLVNEQKIAGKYDIKFDASHLPSGVYFYKIQSGVFVKIKKMLLIK